MNNVFGCGVSWGDHRKTKPYIDIFLEKKIAFVGMDNFSIISTFKKDDYIVIKKGKKALYVGKGTGEYYEVYAKEIIPNYEIYDIGENDKICVINVDKWVDISKYEEQVDIKAFFKIGSDKNPEKFITYYNEDSDNKQSNLLLDLSSKLLKSKNLILTGAPGTGKTYLAKKLAASVILNKEVKNYNDLNEDEKNIVNSQTEFIQFHPSYDYTDFVEGIKPTKDKSFERHNGIFKDFCKKALKNFIDSRKEPIEIETEKIVQKYLEKFISDVSSALEESENNQYPIIGLGKTPVKPIIEIEYDKISNYVFIYTLKKDGTERKTRLTMDKLVFSYLRYIEIKDRQLKTDEFNKHLEITGHHSYIHGFYYAFDQQYGKEIQNIINRTNSYENVKLKKYIFIIDEINRGDLNKILGELFYAIDPGYRGEKGRVKTQYNNLIDDEDDPFEKGFYIPENVYIVGTMNDIDRSVESMDFAIRRRFAWQKITYDMTYDEILSQLENKEYIQPAKDKLNAINAKITELLGKEYNIGASYFLKLKECNNDFQELWKSNLSGVLFEYFRGVDKDERDKYLEEFKNIIVNNIEIDMDNID